MSAPTCPNCSASLSANEPRDILRGLGPIPIVLIPCVGAISGLADLIPIFADGRRRLSDHIAGTHFVEA